jgi:hypothetical protein
MLISFEIQKFRSLEMLKFINVEVYISKTLGVFLNGLSISQSCTHRERILRTGSSLLLGICWHRSHGSFLKFKSTGTTWCSQHSSPMVQQFPRAPARPLFQPPQPLIPMALALWSSGQRSARWLLDSDLVFRGYPSPSHPCLVFLFHYSL